MGWDRYFDETDPLQVAELCQALAETGLRVNSIHTPFGPEVDFSSLEDTVRARGLEIQRQALALAREVQARCLVLHLGDGIVPSEERSHRRARAAGSLQELVPEAEASGVILALENLLPGHLGDHPEELLDVLHQTASNHVAVCFDVGHAHVHGAVLDFARELFPYTTTTHLHDNEGQEDTHLFPGLGSISWIELAQIYAESDCQAPLMVECAPPEGWDWRRCREFFSQIWEGS